MAEAEHYYPAFAEYNYRSCGHITPLTEIELRRIATEAGFSKTEFYYPLPGRMPKTGAYWQSLLPSLRGRLWSDTTFALFVK